MKFLRINALTREDRHEVLSRVKQAVSDSGAWVTDFHQYSNFSVCLNFEIDLKNVAKLHDAIKDTKLRLSDETEEELVNLASAPPSGDEVRGTIQIGFFHDEPDLRIEVPPIPG